MSSKNVSTNCSWSQKFDLFDLYRFLLDTVSWRFNQHQANNLRQIRPNDIISDQFGISIIDGSLKSVKNII